MNNKSKFSLSEYQRATLTEMGIPTWQQVAVSAEISKPVDCAKNDEINLSHGRSSDESLQSAGSADTQDIKQTKSIPQNVLLLMPEPQSAHPLIKDVLNTLNLPLNVATMIGTGNVDEYVDYLLAWEVAPEMTLNGTVLSTPDLSQLSSPEAKKQLWRILQNCRLSV